MPVKVVLVREILEENNKKASDLRAKFQEAGVKVVNIMSSPGAGKTSLLETTIPRLQRLGVRVGVIEGDIETSRDSERLSSLNIPLVQLNTLGECHLEAAMIWTGLPEIDLSSLDVLFIENVGNLVCPSEYDLGEDLRIVVLSTTEGGDKPSKYPAAFLTSQVVVISKTDLIPYTDFNTEKVLSEISAMKGDLKTFQVSVKTGSGMDEWSKWLADWVKGR